MQRNPQPPPPENPEQNGPVLDEKKEPEKKEQKKVTPPKQGPKKKAPKKGAKTPEKPLTPSERLADIQKRAEKIRAQAPYLVSPDGAYKGGHFDQYVEGLRTSLLKKADEIKDEKAQESTKQAIETACTDLLEQGKRVISRPFKDSTLTDDELKKDFQTIGQDTSKLDMAFKELEKNTPADKKGEIKAFTDEKTAEVKKLGSEENYKAEMNGIQQKLKRRDEMSHHIAIANRNDRFRGNNPWKLISPPDYEYSQAKAEYEARSIKSKSLTISEGAAPVDEAKVDFFEKIVKRFKDGLKNKEEMIWQLDKNVYDPDQKKVIKNPFQIRVTEEGKFKVEYTAEGHKARAGTFRLKALALVRSNDKLLVESRLQLYTFASEMKGTNTFRVSFKSPIKSTDPGALERRIKRIQANLDAAERHGRVRLKLDNNAWRALEDYRRRGGKVGLMGPNRVDVVEAMKAQYNRLNQNATATLDKEKTERQVATQGRKEAEKQTKQLAKEKDFKPVIKTEAPKEDAAPALGAQSLVYQAIDKAIDERGSAMAKQVADTIAVVDQQLPQVQKAIESQGANDPAIKAQLVEMREMVITARSLCEVKTGTDQGQLAKEVDSFKEVIAKHGPDSKVADIPLLSKGEPAKLLTKVENDLQKPRSDAAAKLGRKLAEIDGALKTYNEKENLEAKQQLDRESPASQFRRS